MVLTFKKGGAVKYIDPASSLVPLLKEAGWEIEKPKVETQEKPSRKVKSK